MYIPGTASLIEEVDSKRKPILAPKPLFHVVSFYALLFLSAHSFTHAVICFFFDTACAVIFCAIIYLCQLLLN